MANRTVEAIITLTVRRRAVVVLDENDHIVEVEEEIEDIEENDLELEEEVGPVDEWGPTEFDQKDFI